MTVTTLVPARPSGPLDATTAVTMRAGDVEALLPCHRADPDLYFAETQAEIDQAKQTCLACPIRTACLEAALERREPWGVWGGELFQSGAVIPRKRPRGRPRKQPVAA